jgi:hypothetical protein
MQPKQMKASKQQKRSAKPRVPRTLGFTMVPPANKRVKLCYPYWTSITESAANAGAFKYYRLNSVYDVDTTAGSTATPGFAEWSTFYSNYRVWRTRVKIEGAVSGGSSGSLATVSLVVNPLQATLPSNSNEWPVQPESVHVTIVPESNGGHNMAVLDKEFVLPKVFKITRRQFIDNMDYTATIASNPARQGYVAVTVSGVSSSTPVTLAYQIYVAMEIEFFNPIQLAS